ncbi:MAG TPA: TIM barrel protein [Bryobacteraceae bacterium]|jgi:sugar phosphate isomerase/epimerase
MEHVVSTRSLAGHRLTTVWLNRIWDAHIPRVELYCARQHFDYRDKAQIGELGHWFRDAELKVLSAHSPVHSDTFSGRSGPESHLNITETRKANRIQVVDEIKRAIEVSETIPFTYFIQHLGVEYDEYDERRLDAAFTSLEELNLFARQRGVEILLENMNSGMASAERLDHFNNVTHLKLKYCFDVGHAHRMPGGVAGEFEIMRPGVKVVHVHDNNGKEDSHSFPFAPATADSGVAWQKLMHLVRRGASNAALVLETSERHESANPLDDARRTFERLASLKPLEDERSESER